VKDLTNQLFFVYDRRDQMTSYLCKDCIDHHLKISRDDMVTDFANGRIGDCPSIYHDQPKKLFELTRTEFPEYDQNVAFIIRAGSEQEARQMANAHARDAMGEGEIWEDKELVECEEVSVEGDSEIILTRFKNG